MRKVALGAAAIALMAAPGLAHADTNAVVGIDYNRVNMLLAVLEKRAGLRLSEQDVYVNVAGGIRIVEPAADLAVAIAVASTFRHASSVVSRHDP